MQRLRMAACGVDCNECGQYKITSEHNLEEAEGLVDWFRSMGWIGENEGAEAVMKKASLCKGCWDIADDCFWKCIGGNCGLRACCEERQIDHCGECGDFPCGRYKEFADGNDWHQKAMERLLSLRANT